MVKIDDLKKQIDELLIEIQNNLFEKAKKVLEDSIVDCKSLNDLKKAVEKKKIGFAPFCGERKCEDELKAEGVKILNIPDEQPSDGSCIICGKKSEFWAYVGKSY